jgi:hypothetical protein
MRESFISLKRPKACCSFVSIHSLREDFMFNKEKKMGTPQTQKTAAKGTIDDHQISNLSKFQKATNDPRQVAGLYFYMKLDCLIDLAYKISRDFFKRPHLYTDLGRVSASGNESSMSVILAKLNARYGSDEKFPSREQRKQIYEHIFGKADVSATDQGEFSRLSEELTNAAAAFAERVYDTGEDMLRARVRTTHRPFKEYLVGLQGDSVRWSKDEALSDLTENISYAIFRSEGIAAVFGISFPSSDEHRADWPYFEDSNADKLIEQTSKQLMLSQESDSPIPLTRQYISNLQRAALRGAEAIATIIDFDERSTNIDPTDLNLLITKCYTWGSSLKSIEPHHSPGPFQPRL